MDHNLLADARRITKMTEWKIQMDIPSVLAEGEEFSLKMTVTDGDFLPNPDLENELVFENSQGIEGLPASFRFDPASGGIATLDGLTATGNDVAVVVATVKDSHMPRGGSDPVVESNPAWVFPDPEYRIYWGDIHVHTAFSNCSDWACKDPEFCYQYAKEVTHLDFAAPADHLRGIAWEEHRWPHLQNMAKKYNLPGEFVSFLGFESSHSKGFGGDNNVYYAGDDEPYFWVDREDMKGVSPKVHLQELWEWLDQNAADYMTIPHHTARMSKNRTFDEKYYDPEREPLFEIYSSWGSSEKRLNHFQLHGGNSEENAYFVDALKAGCRYGVIASSDDHQTLPGAESRHRGTPYGFKTLTGYSHHGLAGIKAKTLTRDSLWQNLKKRNCYATTLMKTLLDFRIGDANMGEEITVTPSDGLFSKRVAEVDYSIHARRGAKITLVCNGEDLYTESLPRDGLMTQRNSIQLVDERPLDQIAIRDSLFHPAPFAVYYLRIESGEFYTQWSSPIWIDLV